MPMWTEPTAATTAGSAHGAAVEKMAPWTRSPLHRRRSARHHGPDAGGGLGNRVDAGGTEAVHRHPRHRFAPARQQGRRPRDVGALLADLRGDTEHDVVHLRRIQCAARHRGALQGGDQVQGRAIVGNTPLAEALPRGVRT